MADNEGFSGSMDGHHSDTRRSKHGGGRPHKKTSTRDFLCSQLVSILIFAVGVVGGILIGIYAYHGTKDDNASCVMTPDGQHGTGRLDTTPAPQPRATDAPSNPGAPCSPSDGSQCPNTDPIKDTNYEDQVFAPLTTREMDIAARVLQSNRFISTLETPSNLTQDFVLYMYLYPPIKAEALRYLDNGGPNPGRYAQVHVQRGSAQDVMQFKVGPLGTGSETATPVTNEGDIHFNARPYDFLEVGAMETIVAKDMEVLAPLLSESFDGAKYNRDIYTFFYNGPPGLRGAERETRFALGFKGFRDVELDLLHMLPVSGFVHNPGSNVSEWYSYDYYYLNQGPYATAADLMKAYNSNAIRKVKMENGHRDTLWQSIFPQRDTSLPLREKADVPGPRTYLPGGPRYTIHGTKVRWMDWEFEVSGSQIRGPALFNIKFKGERIIYEHAVNDIALNYAMDSSGNNNIVYLDATYGIMGGDYPTRVIHGIDCPEHGTLLHTTYWHSMLQKAFNNSGICVFEADGEEALWRHAGAGFKAGLRNRHLVVRTPVTIGNYDYTFDFDFYLDGKIFTMAKASGYIQASFWDADNPHAKDNTRDAFGYRVSDYSTGPVHDHMFGFKVDMDIIEKNNTFEIIKWKSGSVLEALQTQSNITSVPPYFIYNQTRYIEWERQEREIGLDQTPEQQFWLIVNDRKKNKWGVERGYQIAPLVTASQALKPSHPALKAMSFTKYHCAVTKRKEEEQTLTSIYDVNRMAETKHDLDSQLDNEYIVDEDLVSWVTVGFLHIPTAEDVPMTVRVEAAFLLRPFNFVDRTATYDMPQYTDTDDGTLTEREPSPGNCYQPVQ